MDNRKKCTLCEKVFESESPAVLTMSGFGNARYICPECEELMDKATLGRDYDEIRSAISAIAERLSLNLADDVAFDSLAEILDEAKERAEKIKQGEYDFSLDGESEGFEEIPEELRETEQDRALDEKEAAKNAVFDKYSTWVCAGVMIGLVIFFLYKFIF